MHLALFSLADSEHRLPAVPSRKVKDKCCGGRLQKPLTSEPLELSRLLVKFTQIVVLLSHSLRGPHGSRGGECTRMAGTGAGGSKKEVGTTAIVVFVGLGVGSVVGSEVGSSERISSGLSTSSFK